MKYGAYDAVRDKCKKHEFRGYRTYHKRIEKGGYTEIHMFRGHCYDYINNPWMRITYNNKWEIVNATPLKPIFAGPYCNTWVSEAMTVPMIKMTLGTLIEEGGPSYQGGPPYPDVVKRQRDIVRRRKH